MTAEYTTDVDAYLEKRAKDVKIVEDIRLKRSEYMSTADRKDSEARLRDANFILKLKELQR